eukprot:6201740-Pleurochrysis_carterae.AAC.1
MVSPLRHARSALAVPGGEARPQHSTRDQARPPSHNARGRGGAQIRTQPSRWRRASGRTRALYAGAQCTHGESGHATVAH